MSLKNRSNAIWVAFFLFLGAGLIETHRNFYLTLFGMVFWAWAVRLTLPWFQAAPGVPLFSGNPLLTLKGTKPWRSYWVLLMGLAIVLLIGGSRVLIESDYSIAALVCLGVVSLLFHFLEEHSPVFWAEPSDPQGGSWWTRFWPEILILCVGGFFVFSPFPRHFPYFISDNGDNDSVFRFAANFAQQNDWVTPYKDVWTSGYAAMPSFAEGLFLRLVGISKLKDVIFFSIINLIGLLFFYRVLCSYISKKMALFATLLFASSHLGVFFARQNYPAVGFLLPVISATLYFFIQGMEKGEAKYFSLLGALWAFGLMGYITGRFYVFGFVFIFFLALAANAAQLKKQMWLWLFGFGVCVLWYLPMAAYYLQNSGTQNDMFFFFPIHTWAQYAVGDSIKNNLFNMVSSELSTYLLEDNNAEMVDRPFLAPWETLLFLGGFAWCLFRFYKAEFALVFMGLCLGLVADAASMGGQRLPHRLVTALPFAYIFIGIGADRLERTIRAPLANRKYGRWLSWSFLAVFFVFTLIWQYDVFFNQVTRSRVVCIGELENNYGAGTREHLAGWDTYDVGLIGLYHPDGGSYYATSDKGNLDSSLLKNISLPLPHVPQKGVYWILPDNVGRFFGDWLQYYYPQVQEKDLYNSFGDLQFRTWEATPDQVRKALQEKKPKPPTGLNLSWYDRQGRWMGQWQVPSLDEGLLDSQWFWAAPFPWDKAASFRVRGYYLPSGENLALKVTGKVTGHIGSVPIRASSGPNPVQIPIALKEKGWAPVDLQFQAPVRDHFSLDLLEEGPTGWKAPTPARLRVPGPIPGDKP